MTGCTAVNHNEVNCFATVLPVDKYCPDCFAEAQARTERLRSGAADSVPATSRSIGYQTEARPSAGFRRSEAEALARDLGGGWRIEHGVIPVIVLTLEEAKRLRTRIEALDREVAELEKHGPHDEALMTPRPCIESGCPDYAIPERARCRSHDLARRRDGTLTGARGTSREWARRRAAGRWSGPGSSATAVWRPRPRSSTTATGTPSTTTSGTSGRSANTAIDCHHEVH